jgi:hypothetical protein
MKTIDVKIDHYKWILERLGDFKITIDCKSGLGFQVPSDNAAGFKIEALSQKTLVRMLRSDFRDKFSVVKEMKLNELIYAVLGDLVKKAKKELKK